MNTLRHLLCKYHCRASIDGVGDKVMTVNMLALQGDEEASGFS
jgi:hypothetical protein